MRKLSAYTSSASVTWAARTAWGLLTQGMTGTPSQPNSRIPCESLRTGTIRAREPVPEAGLESVGPGPRSPASARHPHSPLIAAPHAQVPAALQSNTCRAVAQSPYVVRVYRAFAPSRPARPSYRDQVSAPRVSSRLVLRAPLMRRLQPAKGALPRPSTCVSGAKVNSHKGPQEQRRETFKPKHGWTKLRPQPPAPKRCSRTRTQTSKLDRKEKRLSIPSRPTTGPPPRRDCLGAHVDPVRPSTGKKKGGRWPAHGAS